LWCRREGSSGGITWSKGRQAAVSRVGVGKSEWGARARGGGGRRVRRREGCLGKNRIGGVITSPADTRL